MLLLGDILRRHARHQPNKVAFVVDKEQVTYAQFNARANRVANVLAARGVGRGDRVAILADNGIDYPAVYFAVARLGAILVPVNTHFRAPEVRYVLSQSESGTLLYAPECAPLVAESASDLPQLRQRLALDDAGDGNAAVERLLEHASDAAPTIQVHEDDPHVMYYTNAVTGSPRGALCSHRSYYLQAAQTQATNRLTDDDIGVSIFPMFQMDGWALPLGFWYNGGTVVIMRRGDPDEILAGIARERATYFYGTPSVYTRLLDVPNFSRYDLTSLRIIAGGTPAMTETMIRNVTERFSTASMSIMYGSVEAGPVSHLNRRNLFRKPTSVGRPVLNVDVRVVRPDGSNCDPGQTGEVAVQSEFVMRGYWKQPEATAAAIRDGWVYTRDLAAFDDEGFLHLTGRSTP